jgi:hypothetical protein
MISCGTGFQYMLFVEKYQQGVEKNVLDIPKHLNISETCKI